MEYTLIYAKRRTVGLSVRDGRLIVRAPRGVPKNEIDRIILSHRAWVEKAMARQEKKQTKEEELTPEKITELRRLAKAELPGKTAYYAQMMGIKYGRITITGAKTRFGSCSSKGNISYSYRLMLYPEAARDYVVVHELCHRKEMNHSPKFYALVAAVLPDYKERRKLLKE